MRFFYTKADRLSSSKDIEKLFREGEAFFSFPIKVILADGHTARSRSAVIVPKKKIPKAHQRNKIKRQLRELIRHELPSVRSAADHPLHAKDFLLLYTHHKPQVAYGVLEVAFNKILESLHRENP